MLCRAPISAHDLQERRGGATLCYWAARRALVLPQPACCHGTHPSEQHNSRKQPWFALKLQLHRTTDAAWAQPVVGMCCFPESCLYQLLSMSFTDFSPPQLCETCVFYDLESSFFFFGGWLIRLLVPFQGRKGKLLACRMARTSGLYPPQLCRTQKLPLPRLVAPWFHSSTEQALSGIAHVEFLKKLLHGPHSSTAVCERENVPLVGLFLCSCHLLQAAEVLGIDAGKHQLKPFCDQIFSVLQRSTTYLCPMHLKQLREINNASLH